MSIFRSKKNRRSIEENIAASLATQCQIHLELLKLTSANAITLRRIADALDSLVRQTTEARQATGEVQGKMQETLLQIIQPLSMVLLSKATESAPPDLNKHSFFPDRPDPELSGSMPRTGIRVVGAPAEVDE